MQRKMFLVYCKVTFLFQKGTLISLGPQKGNLYFFYGIGKYQRCLLELVHLLPSVSLLRVLLVPCSTAISSVTCLAYICDCKLLCQDSCSIHLFPCYDRCSTLNIVAQYLFPLQRTETMSWLSPFPSEQQGIDVLFCNRCLISKQ